jgi:hypothetical protein
MAATNPVRRALGTYSLPYLAAWTVRRTGRMLTGRWRRLPDFLIIGGQRCGTTSLYNYLVEHPGVAPAFMKEVHFFDNRFHKGPNWYRAHFPLRESQVTGEATPYYLFHPQAPARAFATVPGARLIVLLRNPIERAFSQYHHQVRMGLETLSFEEAIEREKEGLAAEQNRLEADREYRSALHQTYSYLARGIYVDQLRAWQRFYDRGQMLVLKSEDFYGDPPAALAQVAAFLGLPACSSGSYPRYNRGDYAELSAPLRQRLGEYFAPHNRRLYEFLGTDLGWQM